AFYRFDIVDAERSCTLTDGEHPVAGIPDVTDRDLDPSPVRTRRAQQDGLFRASSRAAHAAELQHANRPIHDERASATVARVACVARTTIAAALPRSKTIATTRHRTSAN